MTSLIISSDKLCEDQEISTAAVLIFFNTVSKKKYNDIIAYA